MNDTTPYGKDGTKEWCDSCVTLRERDADSEAYSLDQTSKTRNAYVKFPELRNERNTSRTLHNTKASFLGDRMRVSSSQADLHTAMNTSLPLKGMVSGL